MIYISIIFVTSEQMYASIRTPGFSTTGAQFDLFGLRVVFQNKLNSSQNHRTHKYMYTQHFRHCI